jgi:transcriptional regulator with XRE-family HTH domain
VRARESLGLTAEQLDRQLLLGPGWIEGIESGRIIPDLALFTTLCQKLKLKPGDVLQKLPSENSVLAISRQIRAYENEGSLTVNFQYAEFQASIDLAGAKIAEFEGVILAIRDGLADPTAQKTDAVVKSFQKAVEFWPQVNPSDIWWFVIYRAFTDPFNHPASRYGGDNAQSWNRTSGWALERIFVEQYHEILAKKQIVISIESLENKKLLLKQLKTKNPLNVDKADVILSGKLPDGTMRCFGVVHVKASFAERRTDDEPMSLELVQSGYCSPLVTMDCKSTPSNTPINRGELGSASGERSDKRKDIEVKGVFSACFSYNSRTEPTSDENAIARIYNIDCKSSEDEFVKHVVSAWERIKE